MMSSFLAKLYILGGAALLAGYLWSESRGFIIDDGTDERTTLPSGVKGTHAYRRHSFWYSGYQGGK